MNQNPELTSRVGERISWLSGHRVEVQLAYAEIGQFSSEKFVGTYLDVYPLGREYFFAFEVSGKRKLVKTSSVIYINEIALQDNGAAAEQQPTAQA